MDEQNTGTLEVVTPDAQMTRLLELEAARDENHGVLQHSIEDAAFEDGRILKEIHDNKLYKLIDPSWGRYVEAPERWNIPRSVSYELMNYFDAVCLARQRNLPPPNCPYDIRRQRSLNKPHTTPAVQGPKRPKAHVEAKTEADTEPEFSEADLKMQELAKLTEARNAQRKENQPLKPGDTQESGYFTSTQPDGTLVRGFEVLYSFDAANLVEETWLDEDTVLPVEDALLLEEMKENNRAWLTENLKRRPCHRLLDLFEKMSNDILAEFAPLDVDSESAQI